MIYTSSHKKLKEEVVVTLNNLFRECRKIIQADKILEITATGIVKGIVDTEANKVNKPATKEIHK